MNQMLFNSLTRFSVEMEHLATRGIALISYFDIRGSRIAVELLQNAPLNPILEREHLKWFSDKIGQGL